MEFQLLGGDVEISAEVEHLEQNKFILVKSLFRDALLFDLFLNSLQCIIIL